MDLYIFPELGTILRAAAILVVAGFGACLSARRLPHGLWIGLIGIVIVAWVVVPPIAPPVEMWGPMMSSIWRDFILIPLALAVAVGFAVAGHRRRDRDLRPNDRRS